MGTELTLKHILKLTLYVLVDDREVLVPQRRPRTDSSAGSGWKLLPRVPGNFVIVGLAKLFQQFFHTKTTRFNKYLFLTDIKCSVGGGLN